MTVHAPFRLWSRWVLANAVGELVGLGAVFAVGALVGSRLAEPHGAPSLALLALLVVALAAFEGGVVGLAQWIVLRQPLPPLSCRSWVGATVVGAVVAWLLGMIPSTVGLAGGVSSAPAPEPAPAVVGVLAATMGALLGVVLAVAQWWVLRRHLRRALLWLAANAAAWAVGMPVIFALVGTTIAERQTAGALALLIAGLGLAGALVGAVHGLFLLSLLDGEPPGEGTLR